MHERVGKLETSGVIRGYRADVDPESVGLGVTALIGIVEDSGADTDDVLEAFRAHARDRVLLLHGRRRVVPAQGAGRHDRRAGAADRPAEPDPGVASTRTAIALSTKWENRPQPVGPAHRLTPLCPLAWAAAGNVRR